MECRHVWTSWMTVKKVLGGIVFLTLGRHCVLCRRHEDLTGDAYERAA